MDPDFKHRKNLLGEKYKEARGTFKNVAYQQNTRVNANIHTASAALRFSPNAGVHESLIFFRSEVDGTTTADLGEKM